MINENVKKSASAIAKETALATRSLAAFPGGIADLLLMLPNAGLKAFGKKEIPSQAQATKDAFDYLTKDYAKPKTGGEKIRESVYDFVTPGVGNKAKVIGKGTSIAAKAAKEFLKPTALGTSGAAASQAVLNKNPEDYIGATGASLLTSALGGLGKKVLRNVADKTRLARVHNPNAQDKILNEIASRQGLNAAKEADLGKEIIASAEKHRNDYANTFKKRYGKIDSYYNKLTGGNKNEKRFIDVGSTVEWIADEYKKLESPLAKQTFLSSKIGHKFKSLLNTGDMGSIGKNVSDVDKVDVLLKRGFDTYKAKIPYHEARALQKDIMNDLSKALEIGSVEKGQFQQVSKRLGESIGDVFKDDPKMHKYWNKTNDMYTSFLDGDKKRINDILKHKPKPRHNNPGNPIEAYRNTAQKILTKEDPRDLEFVLSGLNEKGKHTISKGLVEELGTQKGKYNPIQGKENLRGLQEETRNPLMASLSKKDRLKIESSDDLLNQFIHEKKQPHHPAHGFTVSSLKKIPAVLGIDMPSQWTGDKSIARTIDALERNVPQSPITKFAPKAIGKTGRSITEPLHQTGIERSINPFEHRSTEDLLRERERSSQSMPDLSSLSTEELLAQRGG